MSEDQGANEPKAEAADRLGRVYESYMGLAVQAQASGQYKDAAAALQLAANVALTIASIMDQPSGPQNSVAAGFQFDEDE